MKRFFLFLTIFLSTLAFAGERVIINPEQDGDLKIKVNDGGVVKDVLSAAGATANVTIGPSGHTGTHTVNGPLTVVGSSTFLDNSSGSTSADSRLRGAGTGYTHGSIRLESTGQGRGAGVYYLNTAQSTNWYFGMEYRSSGDTDNFVINRRSTASATHQADTADAGDADVVNVLKVTPTGIEKVTSGTFAGNVTTDTTIFTLNSTGSSQYLITCVRQAGNAARGVWYVARDTTTYAISEIVDAGSNLTPSMSGDTFRLTAGTTGGYSCSHVRLF